ncbi:iron-siderophore ABC transporter substrate-binding protein [Streptomyces cocklensis]|jgi:iron complex transport system substrate-binding protein|uniref:Iron complex transport system substrate-binding protein n=1 Tax=Actinacidiphila cocklensis TaxID=887465 RepID=A0A9W4DPD3_9ACTN|nr:iron-siderophore ABC transporter substrate-binding protein [Actinacidiphila cocklensis]MDD1057523.1 iron-siderophore ABC transporter substrate-binding protein [Actinacidiphila cocklensis]WSX78956.1 iron-siderophore ABC transporter substrate-binding protein [Streptomyces sp. NBC_00899]CAG6393853.1 Iron complex transport system substrate-binding protein [Actinacidiphila cocklensis]
MSRSSSARSTRLTAVAAVLLCTALATAACSSGGSSDSGKGKDSGKDTAASGTHTVDTAMGPVKVPDHPQRVVVLDTAELDSAITLGVKPVGATSAGTSSGFLDYLPQDALAGITNVGGIASPNLEAVAALRPDLILSSKVRDGAHYDALSHIAPTVLTESTGAPWKADFQLHAAALGRTAQAAQVLAAYKDHVAAVTAALGGAAKAAATKVSMVRFVEGADIRLYGNASYIGTVLKDVGLARPAVQDVDRLDVDVSPEQIDKADGDALFYATYGDPKAAKETQVTGSPLWKQLTAVGAGHAHRVDDQLWYQGIGYTAAGKILDELQQDLTAK